MVRSLSQSVWNLAVLYPFLSFCLSSALARPSTESPTHGAVACESSVCTNIGIQLLRQGGNAADALIGTVLCVGTIAMYHSGIGGGGFMLVRSPNGTYESIDFRETAPAAAYQDIYKDNPNKSILDGLASGVPGELRGLQYLHKQYGLLPWRHVLAPVVSLAREGFEVTQDLVNSMVDASRNSNFLMDNPAWAMDFAPNGTLLKLGDIMTRKRYANTLEVIAQEGVDAFYTGSIAKATIAAIKATNGIMTMGDLKNYTVAIRQPLSIKYHKYKLVSTSAPSSGAVALSALNTVSGYDGFFSDPNQLNLSYHRLNEAIRFAYAQRTKMGDPSFVPGMDRYTMDMISMANGDTTRSKISDFRTFNVSYYDPEGLETVNTPGTSHIVSADISGLAISMTTTINLLFGSQVMVPETGVILNNEMNDFSIPDEINAFGYIPSPSNYISPGKRPLSSISPIMAELPSGKLYLAIGAAGGSHIATTNVQNAIFILSGGLTTSEALARPRFHDQLNPNLVQFEWTFDNATVAYLQNTGANIGWISPDNMSAAQAIRLLHNGTFESASDPRQSSSCAISV